MQLLFSLISMCILAAGPTDAPKAPSAVKARQTYDTQLTWAQGQHDQAVRDAKAKLDSATREARDEYVKQLKAAMEVALKIKDLEEANRIDAAIKATSSASLAKADPFKEVAGLWVIAYANGSTRRYSVGADGETTFFEGERGSKVIFSAPLKQRGNDTTISWPDKRVERLTFGSGRLYVEHFDNSEAFERNRPATLGVGVRR